MAVQAVFIYVFILGDVTVASQVIRYKSLIVKKSCYLLKCIKLDKNKIYIYIFKIKVAVKV